MGLYTVTGRSSLAGGQPEDVSQVLANLDLIAAILNGGIDNANLAAGILASKLAGYPADATKVLKGDGTWGAVAATTYRKTTPRAVNTTVAPTDLLNGEITIAAGAMGVNGTARISLWGDFLNNTGANAAIQRWQLLLGGATIFDTGAMGGNVMGPSGLRGGWWLDAIIQNAGANNSQTARFSLRVATPAGFGAAAANYFVTGWGQYVVPANSLSAFGDATGSGYTVNTALGAALVFNVINGVNNVNYETRLQGALVEVI